jgi:hypothetical protein
MADQRVPEFSELFPLLSHPLPCDCRDRPGLCSFCRGPVAESPRESWIQRLERRLTDRGREQWAAARPFVQHDDGTWIVEPRAGRSRDHFACGFLKWECEKFPETADEMINQFKVQAFRAEEQALRAEDPDDGDDEPNDGDDDSDPSGDVRR